MNHKVNDTVTFRDEHITASGRMTGTIVEVLAESLYLVQVAGHGTYAVTEDQII